MNHRRLETQVLLALLILSVATVLQPIRQVHAAVGDLSVPQSLSLINPGDTITVDVSISGMDLFNGWDIAIWTNTTALNATKIDTGTNNVFGPGFSILSGTTCINNAGTGCSGVDASGVAHSAAVVIPPPSAGNAPFSGVLFTITYKAGAYTYSALQFKLSRIINGGCTPCPDIDHTTEDGSYGTTTAPNISFSIADQFPTVIQGSSVNTTLTVSSINDFTGQVNFAYHPDQTEKGIQVGFNATSVMLNNSTAGVNITISTSPLTTVRGYLLNLTATGPRVYQNILVGLNVQPPGTFIVAVSPSLLRIPQNSTTSTIVTIKSDPRAIVSQEFSGNVTLSVVATNATAILGQTQLFVSPGKSVSTTLTMWAPPSFYGFTYLINVTAVWTKNHDLNSTAQVTLTHLPSDLIPTANPSTLTIAPGHSAIATFLVTSANYFVGYVYPSSTMSGGTARYNETTVSLTIGKTAFISVNVTIDPATVPGNYIVLLTATGQLASGVAIARSVAENIVVQSNGHLVVQLPSKILGIPIPVYFGILGGFAAIFVVLAALLYRRAKSDKDVWE